MTGFTIIPTFDPSVTGSAVAAQFESAVNTAIQYFEGLITTSITVTMAFGYGENGGVAMSPASGASSSVGESSVSWTSLYNAVQATDTTSAVQRAAASLLTAADPTNGAGTFFMAPAEQMALGLAPASSATVGTIGLSVDTYNWSQTGTQNPNGSDAVSEFEHEISEVLGRTDFGGANNDYNLMDMFRYTAAGGASGAAPGSAAGALDQPFVTGYNANAASYFSYNGTTVTLQYDTPTEVAGGADVADWTASVPNDSFDGSGGPGTVDPVSATDLQVLNVLGYSLAPQCFMAGTRIATPGGAAAVETLRPGDLVRTADGDILPVRFVGVQTVRTREADPLILPIRIRAGALAAHVPSRDLVLSPGHAVFVGGVLAQAGALVNGTSIVREQGLPATFGYWHVELDRHALLLAEGCAAESYLPAAEAAGFDNAADRPDLPPAEEMAYPRAKSARQIPPTVRERLAARGAITIQAAAA